ncbi:MAG: hypothetical protein R2878_00815 [Thermoleophilia bacterium]
MLRSAVLTGALLAAASIGAPDTGGSIVPLAAGPSSDGTARELATRRRDPVKLWYRFRLQFTGTINSAGSGERPGGLVQSFTDAREGGYVATSRSATLVTRTCVVRNPRGRKLFSVVRSCRDARTHPKIRRNPTWRKRMREEVGFRANLTGRITGGGYRRVDTPDATPGRGGAYEPCGGSYTASEQQAGVQRAIGSVATSGGSGTAVEIDLRTDGDSFRRVYRSARSCPKFFEVNDAGLLVPLNPPGTEVTPEQDEIQRGIWQPLDTFGAPDGRSLRERLRFSVPPGKFGRRFGVTRVAAGTGAGIAGGTAKIRFTYRITMMPCPGGGRRVKAC